MLTQRTRDRIRTGFGMIEADPQAFGVMFYDTLFRIAPAVRPLFPEGMELQAKKLAETIGTVVQSIDRLEDMAPVLRDLGRRHANYGAEDSHYDVVGLALLQSLAETIEDWDDRDEAAWAALYGIVADLMLMGAREVEPRRA